MSRGSTVRRTMLAARWAYLIPWAAALCLIYRTTGPRRRFGSLLEGSSDTQPRERRPSPSIVLRAVRLGSLPRPLRASCLVRAMASGRMLRHYGYPAKVVIGVPGGSRPDADWKAHAWVALGTSGPGTNGFLEIARFSV